MTRLLSVTALAWFVLFLHSIAGVLEGAILPVLARMELSEIVEIDETHVQVQGRSRRLRSCAVDRIEWYLGAPRARALVDVIFVDGSGIAAEDIFGPFVLPMNDTQLRNRSHAVIFHRCHRFWLTQTRLF